VYDNKAYLLVPYATWTLGAAGIGICITTFVLIGNLKSTFLICACVCTTMAGLTGYSASVLGLQFSFSFVTSLIICLGFSVDYCAHVVIAYLTGGLGHTASAGQHGNHGQPSNKCGAVQEPCDVANAGTRSKLYYTFQVPVTLGYNVYNYNNFCKKELAHRFNSMVCLEQTKNVQDWGLHSYV
jgi:hypothetical protein